MSDKIFIDTNILIYFHSKTEPAKQRIAQEILDKTDILVISTQVINEFINVLSKKQQTSFERIEKIIQELSDSFHIAYISIDTIRLALKLSKQSQYSYFDSLMLAAALENNCAVIYTEDMHHGQLIESHLTIINPFKAQ